MCGGRLKYRHSNIISMTQQLTQYSAFAMEPGSQLSILDPNTRGAKRHSCTLS